MESYNCKFIRLLVCLFVSATRASQDPHVFYLETAAGKCLTVDSKKLRTDVDCSGWDQQQWLFMETTNKIVSVSIPDLCLELESTANYKVDLCSKSISGNQFTEPATLTVNSNLNFTAYHTAEFTVKSDKSGLAEIEKSTCIYQDISRDAQNAIISTSSPAMVEQKGFNLGDQTSWSCQPGYRSVENTTYAVATCQSDGSWSARMSCIRVRCDKPISKQPVYEETECRQTANNLCISEDKKANAFRLIDNKLVEYVPEQHTQVHFFFDDEIVYKCPENSHRNSDGSSDPISSVCSADGTWTVPQPMCKGKCERQIIVKAGEESCGVWMTENFPENYENDMRCPVKFFAEDPTVKFNIQVRYVKLEYLSQFATSCSANDKIVFRSYEDNFKNITVPTFAGVTWPESAICSHSARYADTKNFGSEVSRAECEKEKSCLTCPAEMIAKKSILSYNTEWNYWKPKLLTSSTNQLMAIFDSDKDTVKTGVAFTWWTSNSNGTCKEQINYEFPEEMVNKLCDVSHNADKRGMDEKYGIYSDLYHYLYILLLVLFSVTILKKIGIWLFKLLTCKYRKVSKSDSNLNSDSEGSDSDEYSESDSDYELEEDEDDVDDFSLLTLLEMKANRIELGNAVDKLTNEITHLEKEEERQKDEILEQATNNNNNKPLDTNNMNPQLLPQNQGNSRRMSNINKIHQK